MESNKDAITQLETAAKSLKYLVKTQPGNINQFSQLVSVGQPSNRPD
jgi:hypothetical protein